MNIRKLMTAKAVSGAAAAMMTLSSAQAAVVIIDNITATWQNPTGASVTYRDNGTDNARVAWGTPATSYNSYNKFNKQSGYDFDAVNSSISTGDFSTPYNSGTFEVGTFTHRNNPITGNSLSSIELLISADLSINGAAVQTYDFTFNFLHDETPNSGSCPYGGPNNHGVNINGCADKVLVNFNSVSDSFYIDGTRYTLNLTGFLDNGSPATSFLSKEKGSNSATIVGQIAAWTDVVPGGVPEPSTWAMLILGFGAVGGTMRRRNANGRKAIAALA